MIGLITTPPSTPAVMVIKIPANPRPVPALALELMNGWIWQLEVILEAQFATLRK